MVLAVIIIGIIGMFAVFGPFYCLPSTFSRGPAAAGGIGLFTTIGMFDGFFGPSLFGVLKEATGDNATAAFGMMLAALIVLAVGCATAPRPAMAMPKAGVAG